MSGGSGIEQKRRHPRFSVDLMSVSGRMVRATEVTVLGVSADEVTLVADMRLNIGNHYSLRLSDSTDSVTLRGAVLWSVLNSSKKAGPEDFIPQYKAAIKIERASAGILAKLAKNIGSYDQVAAQPQAASAHGDSGGCRMILDFPEGYRVKKISLGGALIETGSKAEVEKRFPMEVALPDGTSIAFRGRVASCLRIPDQVSERYDVGIEFLDLQEGQRRGLANFIQQIEIK